MKVTPTRLPEVLVIEPNVFGDARGFFFESFNAKRFSELTGFIPPFVQDNHSRSVKGVLRIPPIVLRVLKRKNVYKIS